MGRRIASRLMNPIVGFSMAVLRIAPRRVSWDLARISEVFRKLRPHDVGIPLVRFGADGDGGYLVPDDLGGIAGLVSPGVGPVASFELDLAQKGIPVVLVDHTVPSPPESHELFEFVPKRLAAVSSYESVTIPRLLEEFMPPGDLVLQLDIEGDEWSILACLEPAVMLRFRVMVIEFHRLDFMTSTPDLVGLVEGVIGKISENFVVAHAHINNAKPSLRVRKGNRNSVVPPTVEVTFLRKDRVKGVPCPSVVPSPLDAENDPKNKTTGFPLEWSSQRDNRHVNS